MWVLARSVPFEESNSALNISVEDLLPTSVSKRELTCSFVFAQIYIHTVRYTEFFFLVLGINFQTSILLLSYIPSHMHKSYAYVWSLLKSESIHVIPYPQYVQHSLSPSSSCWLSFCLIFEKRFYKAGILGVHHYTPYPTVHEGSVCLIVWLGSPRWPETQEICLPLFPECWD